ncbi:MAG TPA: TetR/AcrR family transcriptional regulator [Mycobacteriales bacterium]|nr:TetR/AcrR family transcriptional regulator [Mycobacteriales bacterium]
MRTRDTSDTRAKILDIARDLFVSQGYVGTSIADIASRLGATKGALYYHFASKEAVLDALVAEPAAELARIAERATREPGVRPAELLGALIDLQARHPAAYLAVCSGDTSNLQEYSQRHRIGERIEQITRALAGPSPGLARLIRARVAMAVIKDGTTMARELGNGRLTEDVRAEILDAALGALGALGDTASAPVVGAHQATSTSA